MTLIRLPGISDPSLSAEEKCLYEAVLDVIDAGEDNEDSERIRIWLFYLADESLANANRLDFARAVIARFRKLKQSDDDEQVHQRR